MAFETLTMAQVTERFSETEWYDDRGRDAADLFLVGAYKDIRNAVAYKRVDRLTVSFNGQEVVSLNKVTELDDEEAMEALLDTGLPGVRFYALNEDDKKNYVLQIHKLAPKPEGADDEDDEEEESPYLRLSLP